MSSGGVGGVAGRQIDLTEESQVCTTDDGAGVRG